MRLVVTASAAGAAIGLLPTYAQAGLLAPLMFLGLRIPQGLWRPMVATIIATLTTVFFLPETGGRDLNF